MSFGDKKRHLARITSADIAEVYNGMMGLAVCFDYEDGGSQCMGGYLIDGAMIVRFMAAVNVMKLREAEGKSCWVTADHSHIYKVEPLHAKDGAPFDIDEWSEWVKETMPSISYSEMKTGKKVVRVGNE